ncbi:MAG: hypothetical protein ACREPV_12065 [Lysobacter sp.]
MIRSLLIGAATLVLASACATTDPAGAHYTVEWFDGFNLAQLGEGRSKPETRDAVRQALFLPWYAPIAVTPEGSSGGERFSLRSCADYLRVADRRVRPADDPTAWVPFMDRALTCQAARLILDAQPATTSHVRSMAFDKTLPERLPWQVAMIISGGERERIAAERADALWSEALFAPLTEFSACGDHCAIYGDEGGDQEVQLVAHGDFNTDGIEDVLIRSFDSVKGGSYRAVRMLVLTRRSADGDYELLEQLDY